METLFFKFVRKIVARLGGWGAINEQRFKWGG
jgi:hypothetical protein